MSVRLNIKSAVKAFSTLAVDSEPIERGHYIFCLLSKGRYRCECCFRNLIMYRYGKKNIP